MSAELLACFDEPSHEAERLVFVRRQSTEDDPIARKLNIMCYLMKTSAYKRV